jgi:hypothetical protein
VAGVDAGSSLMTANGSSRSPVLAPTPRGCRNRRLTDAENRHHRIAA